MKKDIAYIDKVYYNGNDKKVYGDLAYHFCDRDDTRVLAEDADDLRSSLSEYINSEDAEENGDAGYDFSIFYIVNDSVEQDDLDDGAEGRLMGEDKITDVYVLATEERAKDIVESYFANIRADTADIVFHYRDVDDMKEDEEGDAFAYPDPLKKILKGLE